MQATPYRRRSSRTTWPKSPGREGVWTCWLDTATSGTSPSTSPRLRWSSTSLPEPQRRPVLSRTRAPPWSALCLASAVNNPVERVFRRFLRRVLGLRAGTPTAVLLAEAGQYPLSVDILVGLARAWNRYVSMPEERLARQVFDHNLTLMGANITSNKLRAPWSSQMVHCLSDASPHQQSSPCTPPQKFRIGVGASQPLAMSCQSIATSGSVLLWCT